MRAPRVWGGLTNLGSAYFGLGDFRTTIAHHERALELIEATLGKATPERVTALSNIAVNALELGNVERARSSATEALRLGEEELGRDHPRLALPMLTLGRIALAEGDPEQALDLAREALELHQRTGSPSEQVADAKALVARALATSGSFEHARDYAAEALAVYREAPEIRSREAQRLTRWMRQVDSDN